MKFEMIPLILLAGMMAAVPAAAQTPPQNAPANPRAVAVDPSYQIAAGDVLSVNVINFPDLSTPQTLVTPDGTISLQLLDAISVAGMTQQQVAKLLANKWKKYVINPSVTVSLVQKHAQIVVLNGYLNHTGTVDYHPGLHLLEVLAQMGGALTTADPANSVLTHADGSKQVLDLSHPETKSDSAVNVELQPGDVLYVPEQQGKISVVGEVKQPGAIYYKENLTVLDIITASGGTNTETADLRGATLTHNGVDKKLNLYALMHDGDIHANMNVEPGDILTIPELHNRVYVYGDVEHQGFYNYKPQDRITDAFAYAGLASDADTSKINVIHVSKDKKVAHLEHVNLNKFLHEGDASGNPEIQSGDALYIPKQHKSFKLEDIFAPLSAVGSISYTTRLLQGK